MITGIECANSHEFQNTRKDSEVPARKHGHQIGRDPHPLAIFVKELVELKEIGDGLLIDLSKVSQLNHIYTPLPGF